LLESLFETVPVP